MRVLILGPRQGEIQERLGSGTFLAYEDALSAADLTAINPDIAVSFGYRHIVRPDVLGLNGISFINIHISLLPWNRGADPNLWSWLENSPRGVSLHWMSERLDEGDLLAQKQLDLDPRNTLRRSYELLTDSALSLLQETWPQIRDGSAPRFSQQSGGTVHRSSDKTAHIAALKDGWDTPCRHVLNYGYEQGLWITSS